MKDAKEDLKNPFRSPLALAKDEAPKLWFRRKLYGWGWTPCSIEGWLVTLSYIGLILFYSLAIDPNASAKDITLLLVLPGALLTALLLWICYKKGEKPRWQWGPERDKGI